jgi:tRNA (guanine-N7-)-methyltransferase
MANDAMEGFRRRRNIEREFGVPFAGELLPQDQWAKTALKLDSNAPFDAQAIFGRANPLVVDLGCGNGRFLIGSAVWRPNFDHLGVDELPLVIRYAVRRANQRGLTNIRFATLDSKRLVERLPSHSVAEMHIYHPQPYNRPEEFGLRLLTPRFLADVHSRLETDGKLFLQTDHPAYWEYLESVVPLFFDFHHQIGPWPDAPKGRTRREIIALKRRLPVFRGWGSPKTLDASEIDELADRLPLPTFDADRSLCALDEMETG